MSNILKDAINQDRIAAAHWLLDRAEQVKQLLYELYEPLRARHIATPGYGYCDYISLTHDGAFCSDGDDPYPENFTLSFDLLTMSDDEIREEALKVIAVKLKEHNGFVAKRQANTEKQNKETLKMLLNQYGHPDTWNK